MIHVAYRRAATGLLLYSLACYVFASACLASTPAATPPSALPEIVKALSSATYEIREAAQRRLERLPIDQLDTLRKLADTQSDPEVKVRLEAGVEQLEIIAALHPPPVSVALRNADLRDAVEALNREMGRKFLSSPFSNVPFTLTADKQPFWELVRRLDQQHPLTVYEYNGQLRLSMAGGSDAPFIPERAWSYTAADGMAMAGRAYRGIALPDGESTLWQIDVTAFPDPRIPLSQGMAEFTLTQVVDDAGHDLTAGILPRPPGTLLAGPKGSWTSMSRFRAPADNHARSLATVKGILQFVIVYREHKTIIADVVNQVRPIPAGNMNIVLDLQDVAGTGAAELVVQVMPPIAGPTIGGFVDVSTIGPAEFPPPFRATVVDAKGDNVRSGTGQGTARISLVDTRPLNGGKLEVTWPLKKKDVQIPFELKNIPVR